jgi:DNA-binding response OmpR family regulator
MAARRGAPQARRGWDAGETLTILVVEDDVAVAELLREVLNDVPGWGATVVHDAAAARRVGRVVRVEALVLNLHLPGRSGLELLALWAADPAAPRPPVVLTTADPEHPAVRAAVAAGEVAALVPKPFDVDELVAAVHRVDGAPRRTA